MYRFFVEPNQIGEESIVIVGKDVNHIKNVLRMKIGETILISDGSDKEYICSVEKIADDEITAKIEDINGETRELPIKVTLFQALPKGDKMETIIQKNGGTWCLSDSANVNKTLRSEIRFKEGS